MLKIYILFNRANVYLLVFPLHLHKLILHLELFLLHLHQLLVFGLHLLLLPGDLQQRLHLRKRNRENKPLDGFEVTN